MSTTAKVTRATGYAGSELYELRNEFNEVVDVLDLIVSALGLRLVQDANSGDLAGLASPSSSAIAVTTNIRYIDRTGNVNTLTSDDAFSQSTETMTSFGANMFNAYYFTGTSDSTPGPIIEGTAATALALVTWPVPSTANAIIGCFTIATSSTGFTPGTDDFDATHLVTAIFEGPAYPLAFQLDKISKILTT